jgi:hypothetical protein
MNQIRSIQRKIDMKILPQMFMMALMVLLCGACGGVITGAKTGAQPGAGSPVVTCSGGSRCSDAAREAALFCSDQGTFCCGGASMECRNGAECLMSCPDQNKLCHADEMFSDEDHLMEQEEAMAAATGENSPPDMSGLPYLKLQKTFTIVSNPWFSSVEYSHTLTDESEIKFLSRSPRMVEGNSGFNIFMRGYPRRLEDGDDGVSVIVTDYDERRREIDSIEDSTGCIVSLMDQDSDGIVNMIQARRRCRGANPIPEQEPALLAYVKSGEVLRPTLHRGLDFHVARWLHKSDSGKITPYAARLRASDMAVLDPGGVVLPFITHRTAIAGIKGAVLFAWIDSVQSAQGWVSSLKIARGTERGGRFEIGAPTELFRGSVNSAKEAFGSDIKTDRNQADIAVSTDDRAFLLSAVIDGRLLAFSLDAASNKPAVAPLEITVGNRVDWITGHYSASQKAHLVTWRTSAADAKQRFTQISGALLRIGDKGPAITKKMSYGNYDDPDVFVSAAHVLAVTRKWDPQTKVTDLYGVRFQHTGKRMDSRALLLTPIVLGIGRPAVAFGDGVYLVAWADERNLSTSDGDIFAMRIRASDLKILDAQSFPVSTAPGKQSNPWIAFSEGRFVVGWEDSRNQATTGIDIYAARVLSATGEVLDRKGIAVAQRPLEQSVVNIFCADAVCRFLWRSGMNSENGVNGQLETAELNLVDGRVKSPIPADMMTFPPQNPAEKILREICETSGTGCSPWDYPGVLTVTPQMTVLSSEDGGLLNLLALHSADGRPAGRLYQNGEDERPTEGLNQKIDTNSALAIDDSGRFLLVHHNQPTEGTKAQFGLQGTLFTVPAP